MIRVLQILPGLNRGGMETFIMNIYREIDRTKIQFDFLINCHDGDYVQEIKSLGGEVFYIPPRREGYENYLQNLNKFFRQNASKYNAIHYHESSLSSLEPLYFATRYGIKTRIMHSHNSKISGNKLHYLTHALGKLSIRKLATNYLGCSDKAIKWMYGGSGILRKAELIKNGINTADFKFNLEKREYIRTLLNLQNKKVIGHVGRFMKVKNHEFLLHILKSLLMLDSSYHLVLVGTGELESSVKSLAVTLGIAEHISFLGVRSDINIIMQGLDAFVMPSLYEGLPVVLVEAQTSGLPVICSDAISSMSKLTDNYYSLSLNDTYEKWASTINQAIMNTDISDREKSIRNIVSAGFDIKNTTSRLFSLYSK